MTTEILTTMLLLLLLPLTKGQTCYNCSNRTGSCNTGLCRADICVFIITAHRRQISVSKGCSHEMANRGTTCTTVNGLYGPINVTKCTCYAHLCNHDSHPALRHYLRTTAATAHAYQWLLPWLLLLPLLR